MGGGGERKQTRRGPPGPAAPPPRACRGGAGPAAAPGAEAGTEGSGKGEKRKWVIRPGTKGETGGFGESAAERGGLPEPGWAWVERVRRQRVSFGGRKK